MFIAALFTTANIWKQLKCPSTDKWLKKMWCTHTHPHPPTPTQWNITAIKKNEILPFATTWMDLEDAIPSEVSQTEKDIILYDITCGI